MDERDMISSLPDCLIHLIMSFLTAQEAVQTCVLSKSWKNLWTTLPFLDFDLYKFEYDGKSDDSEWDDVELERIKFEKFRDFVNTTLLLRDGSDLRNLRLSLDDWKNDVHKYHMIIKSWILFALKHNLQVLNIDFQPVALPLGVFTCASLVDASLDYPNALNHIKVINLPCLRRLYLHGGELNQDSVDKLFCGCPVLEFLHLEHHCKEFLIINSQSLKYLKIHCVSGRVETEKLMELINTPNLLSFFCEISPEIFGRKIVNSHKVLLKMPILTSAHISLDLHYKVKGMLIGLSNVQNLTFSGPGIKDLLENDLPNHPEFSILKNLNVKDFCLCHHFNLLASFLNHCPNLEKLSLEYLGCQCCAWVQVHGNQESLKIAPFDGKQLKVVEVQFVEHNENLPRFVKHLQEITRNSSAQINMTSISLP
ncbi:hypothetical protein LUZ63_015950 [Rhynchospora breviuscula]|uniref:F-box domain-containing protein n=1 Tax=Rhynchospora breviuscula TaxID=2022672 RepID=A0A9Q0CDD2_9POAL|nr:hypothetical protein LUZ63_015950 [Rhynchospora breviuscula]